MSVRPSGLAAVTAMVVLGALAGCGHSAPAATTGLGSVNSSPTATASPTASPTPTATATPTTKPPSYPKTAQGYAQAGLDAYTKHNTARLTDLTSAAGKITFDNIHPTNSHWHYHDCQGAAGSSYCTFDNDNGDRLQIQVDNTALGGPHGLIGTVLDVTMFDTDAHAYVNTFMQAFYDKNTYRMKALSNGTITSFYLTLGQQGSWMLDPPQGAAGSSYVHITNLDGFDQWLRLENDKLGSKHAIVAHCDSPGAC